MEKLRIDIKSIAIYGLFVALIAIGGFIKIPLPIIPITLQSFIVILSALILGGKKGAFCCLLYLLIGLFGLPIFAQGGGFFYVLKPSFGYLVGFVLGAFVTGYIAENTISKTKKMFGAFVGLAVIYLFGTLYCFIIYKFYMKVSVDVLVLLSSCIFFTLPVDIALNILSVVISERVNTSLSKM